MYLVVSGNEFRFSVCAIEFGWMIEGRMERTPTECGDTTKFYCVVTMHANKLYNQVNQVKVENCSALTDRSSQELHSHLFSQLL
jgi:hypothetical protein